MFPVRMFVLCLIILVVSPNFSSALSVGMAPPVYDLGTVERGNEYYMDFYIITDHDRNLLVDLRSEKAPYDFYQPERQRFRYDFLPENASEEDVSSWITFLEKNPIIVPPEKRLYSLSNGGLARANKKITAVIKIPKNSEPGYHAGYVVPVVREKVQGGGAGIGIITTAKMGYVFNVAGDAVRSGKIIGFSYDPGTPGTLNVIFKNTGTLTMTVKASNINVSTGAGTQTLSSRMYVSRPGQITKIPVAWNAPSEGTYHVSAAVEWTGGKSAGSGKVYVTPEATPSIGKVSGKAASPSPSTPSLPVAWLLPVAAAAGGFFLLRRKT